MTSDSKNYRHIAVNADEEDIVIQAGSKKSTSRGPVIPDSSKAASTSVEVTPAESAAPASASSSDAAQANTAQAAPAQPQPKKPTDEIPETTLEDLKGGSSTTQKVIIVVAVLAIVAFVAWTILH